MKIIPLKLVICRTPAFGIEDTLTAVFDELKAKIKESSPAFYEVIAPYHANDLNLLNEKARFTLWKYFNRAKYRATPFGSFAAITCLPLSAASTALIVAKEMINHHFIDWSKKEMFNDLQHTDKTSFLSNASIYFTGSEIRYIRYKENLFELAAVNAMPELNTILITCKRKTSATLLYELMQATFEMDKASTSNLLQQLLNMQLLSADYLPNITGIDYFERLGVKSIHAANDYIVSERKLITGNFDASKLKELPELVNFLVKQLKPHSNADLENFKQAFVKRFEHQEVSLAKVMDPEIGIGYGNFAQLHGTNQLVDEIKQAKQITDQETIGYSELNVFLLNKIITGQPISLEEFDTKKITPVAKLPNTFSFIFHLYHAQPVIAFAGGCTANSLLGRFTLGNTELENYGKEIAAIEMEANPGVIFFDIAYQAEKRIDNVNRRKTLYPYELPILTWSDTADPLDFNDIMVTVSTGEVILRSKKLDKRLVPRISSAYNYTRSDLAVFRFLCDLQTQGLLTNLSFKLQDFFPKLQHYPRVSFKEIIVSPAMWLVPPIIYTDMATNKLAALKKWLQEQQISFSFKVGLADHVLYFDPDQADDLLAFISYCRQQQQEDIYITEALHTKKDDIKDEKGTHYVPQFIVNYKHDDLVYHAVENLNEEIPDAATIQLPGGDWLYFEIYIHPSSSALLLSQLNHFLKAHARDLKKWFFVRYYTPNAHIRLRLHLKEPANGYKFIAALKQLLAPKLWEGRISDFKIKTYRKESQRYGINRIDLVEQFFYIDSKFVLHLLKRAKTENQLMANSLNLILTMFDKCLPTIEAQISFATNMANNFAEEMAVGSAHFKKINIAFNEWKRDVNGLKLDLPLVFLKAYQKMIDLIMQNCQQGNEQQKMLADLIHMHINRLYPLDQRVYETIIYHYLLRILQTKRALLKV